jgi:molecular chaperone DnaK
MAADNKTLARFILDGIPPAARGTPQVEVNFDIDANGILNVGAKDKASGKSQSVRIEASTSLSKEEIEKLKAEAAKHADEDKKKRDAAEARNIAENLIYVSEKSLKDAGEKVTPEIRASVEAKINDLKKVKDSGDVEIIKKATDELSTEIQKIGGAMYNKDNKADDTSSAKQSE